MMLRRRKNGAEKKVYWHLKKFRENKSQSKTLTALSGNCRNSLYLTLFSQKFRESNGFTKEVTKVLI